MLWAVLRRLARETYRHWRIRTMVAAVQAMPPELVVQQVRAWLNEDQHTQEVPVAMVLVAQDWAGTPEPRKRGRALDIDE